MDELNKVVRVRYSSFSF